MSVAVRFPLIQAKKILRKLSNLGALKRPIYGGVAWTPIETLKPE
jgi:hypothetical protein